ncbi:MAG: hypothetical protein WD512_20055, partial [Candidatus Paceibacterota bacterium]
MSKSSSSFLKSEFTVSIKSNNYRFVSAEIMFHHDDKKSHEHTIDCISSQNICEVNVTIGEQVKFPNQFYVSGKIYLLRIYYFNKSFGGFKCEKDTLDFTIDKNIKFTLNVPPQLVTMKGRKISDLVGVYKFNYPEDRKVPDSKKRSHEESSTSAVVASTSSK